MLRDDENDNSWLFVDLIPLLSASEMIYTRYCVGWGAKLYSLTHSPLQLLAINSFTTYDLSSAGIADSSLKFWRRMFENAYFRFFSQVISPEVVAKS